MTKSETFTSLLMSGVILVSIVVGIYQLRPSEPVSANASPAEFSSGRAMKHIEAIAQSPHPIGSPEHAMVREYLVKTLTAMGLETQVQESVGQGWASGTFRAGTVRNVVARLKGTHTSRSVLLMAHYDSVPSGPGASDDSASVAMMLETARALSIGQPLGNDIIFLFTDGEEVGLLGAEAFANEHPWAKNVGLVVNLEARGTSGPSIMFETGVENGWSIEGFAKATPHPVANSLMDAIYRLLPNDTDFTVFRKAGAAGFNIAFINGSIYYHTARDNFENINEPSVQHQGAYTLALARHFGDLSMEVTPAGARIYFDILGSVLIHYPVAWTILLLVLAMTLFAGVTALGIRKKRVTFSGIIAGFLAFLLVDMLVAPLIVILVWQGICTLHPEYRILGDNTYNSDLYIVSLTSLAIAVVLLFYPWLRKRLGMENLALGALLLCLVFAVLTSLFLPGGSYLFVWPLLFGLVGLGMVLAVRDQDLTPLKRFGVLSICAFPMIILVVPMAYLIFMALTLYASVPVIVLVVLLVGLLIPQLDLILAPNRWYLPAALTLVSVGLIVIGSLTSGFNADHPRPDSILYGVDGDTNKAVWVSEDDTRDEWTAQFLNADAERDPLPAFWPFSSSKFLNSPAPLVQLAAPDVTLLDNSSNDNGRTLTLHITTRQHVFAVGLYVTSHAQVVAARVNGREVALGNLSETAEAENRWGMLYWAPPQEGITLTLTVKPAEPLTIKVVDRSYGLPEIAGSHYEPRPDQVMPIPFPQMSDWTLVSKTFTY